MSFIGTPTVAATGDAVLLLSQSITGNTSNIGNQTYSPVMDTSGSVSLVVELNCNSTFQMAIEGSNDQQFWSTLWSQPLAGVGAHDSINESGHSSLDSSTRFVRLNFTNIATNGACAVTVYGRSSPSVDSGDRLSAALDQTHNVAMSVVITNLKKDLTGALIVSDGISYTSLLQGATTVEIFDTTGYDSIVFQLIGGGASVVQISNDGANWLSCTGISLATGASVSALATNSMVAFNCGARYIKVAGVAGQPGQLNTYLRANPTIGGTQINGGTLPTVTTVGTVTSVTNPVQSIGSVAVTQSVLAQNPLTMGASDNANLSRRLLVAPASANSGIKTPADVGYLQTGGFDQANNAVATSFVGGDYLNVPASPVMDISQFEGQTTTQLLAAILTELQIQNHYLHELPLLLNTGIAQALDEPAQLRQEQSLFNTQTQ